MKIRNIQEKDIEAVVDIQISGWQSAYRGIIENEFLDAMNREERIEKRKKDYRLIDWIVAEEKGEILGFCRYVEDNRFSKEYPEIEAEICGLYVKPDKKRNGIGKAMLEYALADLKQRGKSKIILWCLKENHPSRRFYEKMGGVLFAEKEIEIGNQMYEEVAYQFQI